MKSAAQKIVTPPGEIFQGQITRAEAGRLIASGCQHLHSFPVHSNDNSFLLTERALNEGTVPIYQWEAESPRTLILKSSQQRQELLSSIKESHSGNIRRELLDKIGTVFEELCTNAIYHSYQVGGGDKYPRKKVANLTDPERIGIYYAWENGGLYLCISDRGGTLKFENIADAFRRCYTPGKEKAIENKDGGAGLGFYMVFEAVSHLKIEVNEGISTLASCWIPEKAKQSADGFSFNFFGRRKPK